MADINHLKGLSIAFPEGRGSTAARKRFEDKLAVYLGASGKTLVQGVVPPDAEAVAAYLQSYGCRRAKTGAMIRLVYKAEDSGMSGDVMFTIDPEDPSPGIEDAIHRFSIIERRSALDVRDEILDIARL